MLSKLPGTIRRLARKLVIGPLQADVDRMARRVGVKVTGVAGDAHDAFGHAYVSARLTRRLGRRAARLLGELNERLGSDAAGKPLEARMDRANNAVGREIGVLLREKGATSRDATALAVREALDAGRLSLIDPGGVLRSSRGETMSESEPRTMRWLVRGRVQGVGFRWFVREAAERCGAEGIVRNLPDGRVECVARGNADCLSALEQQLRRGPSHSRVDDVERSELDADHPVGSGFRIAR